MLLVGKSATQDITLTLYVLAAVQSFREKIGFFIPQDLFKHYVQIIFPKLIEKS